MIKKPFRCQGLTVQDQRLHYRVSFNFPSRFNDLMPSNNVSRTNVELNVSFKQTNGSWRVPLAVAVARLNIKQFQKFSDVKL